MSPEPARSAVSRRGLHVAGVVLAGAVIVIVGLGIATRKRADAKLSEWTENQAVPTVVVAKPDGRGRPTTIELPGRLEAYSQAQIYARVTGYLREWKVDIGSVVKAGQVLAEIDAPDLDQQIMQAEADLASAQANASLSQSNLQRGQSLIQSGSVSRQDLDQRSADAANKQGLVKSVQANLARQRVLEQYKRIVAPFDGLVTGRATDVGSLINAGSGGGPALFVISDTTKLRAYVNVPQIYVPSVKVGTQAQITVPEYPGRTFSATVESSSRSVDLASGTTRMQLAIDNANGELMTGAFANMRLELVSPNASLTVPASALIFNKDGLKIATLRDDSRVLLKQVTIARDLGKEVEIASGLDADDQVIQSPPDGIATFDQVRVAQPIPARSASSQAPDEKPTPAKP